MNEVIDLTISAVASNESHSSLVHDTHSIHKKQPKMNSSREYTTSTNSTNSMARKSKTRTSHVESKFPDKSSMTLKEYNRAVRRMSPSAFIHHTYSKTIPVHDKKKKRVPPQQFAILRLSEFEDLEHKNYTLSQLKCMAKHYGLRLAGNKPEVQTRLYNHLRLSRYAIKIQAVYRGWYARQFVQCRGPALFSRSMCVNDSDFYTLDSLETIPAKDFVSIVEGAHTYGFHIDSLHEYVKQTKNLRPNTTDTTPSTDTTHTTHTTTLLNPYTHSPFLTNIPAILKQCMQTAYRLGFAVTHVVQEAQQDLIASKPLTPQDKLRNSLLLIDEMGHLGNYTNPQWFDQLNGVLLKHFCFEVLDIYQFRIGLTPEQQYALCGGRHCLSPFTIQNLKDIRTRDQGYRIASHMVHRLIQGSTNPEHQKTGAMIVMIGLTIVNLSARNTFPMLYMSVR